MDTIERHYVVIDPTTVPTRVVIDSPKGNAVISPKLEIFNAVVVPAVETGSLVISGEKYVSCHDGSRQYRNVGIVLSGPYLMVEFGNLATDESN